MRRLKDGTIVDQVVYQPPGSKGWFVRGFNEIRQEYLMIDSHFDDNLPRWISDVKVPLVEGKGIPTALYLDLHLMKKLGVAPDKLRHIRICKVHEWHSIFHLSDLTNLGDLFKQTRLFKSRKNVLTQTGLMVDEVVIDLGGASFSHPSHISQQREGVSNSRIVNLCEQYGFDYNQDQVLWNFDVLIKVSTHY
jgi:hypothetical protein